MGLGALSMAITIDENNPHARRVYVETGVPKAIHVVEAGGGAVPFQGVPNPRYDCWLAAGGRATISYFAKVL